MNGKRTRRFPCYHKPYQINPQKSHRRYGHPFDTESVVGTFLPIVETIPHLTKEPDGFSYTMDPQDILYGLGENIRGINKRGWVY